MPPLSLALLALLLLLLLAPSRSLARPEFQTHIPNGDKVIVNGQPWPGVGHYRDTGGGPNNQFGLDFLAQGYEWTQELCRKDSDGDGMTNGQELGDPNCVWSMGDTPERTTDITHPGFAEGTTPTRVIDPCENYTAPTNAFSFNVTFPFYHISSLTTTYVRYAFNITALFPPSVQGNNVHAVRFEPIIKNKNRVHHMLLYSCDPGDLDSGSYFTGPTTEGGMPCRSLIFAWALGGPTYCFPPGVAMLLSASTPDVLLEIHYDNPNGFDNETDASGFMVTGVSHPDVVGPAFTRAAYIWAGISLNKISIPPGLPYYEMTGKCVMPDGSGPLTRVNIIASLSHGHYLARKIFAVASSSVDGDRMMACNPLYSNSLQELSPKSPYLNVTNKDTITVHCIYDSTSKTTVTTGGEATSDEMCIEFLLYYPYVGVELKCLSTDVETSTTPLATPLNCEQNSYTNVVGFSFSIDNNILTHVVLMAIGFGFLVPVGVIIPTVFQIRKVAFPKTWLNFHRGIVGVGFILGISGFAVILNYLPPAARLLTDHGKLGVAIVILVILQAFGGIVRPHVPPPGEGKSQARKIWEVVHPWTGRAIIVILSAQVRMGYTLLKSFVPTIADANTVDIMGWVHVGVVFGGVWFVGTLALKWDYWRKVRGGGVTHPNDNKQVAAAV